MRHPLQLLFIALALLLVAPVVVAQSPGVPKDARKLKDVLTGDAKGAASANPQCKLFTPVEIAGYLGKPVLAGRNAGMGFACHWVSADDEADAMVSVVPKEYHERPTLAPKFKALTEPGVNGFVVPELGGWAAGTIVGEKAIKVTLEGPKASEESAVAFLREAVRRAK